MKSNVIGLIFTIVLGACHALSNRHDEKALQCDISAKTGDSVLIRFTNPDGLNLSPEQLAQLRVLYETSTGTESLQASPQGCVMVPVGKAKVKASIASNAPLSAEFPILDTATPGTIRSVALEAPGYLQLGLKCPKNGLLASTSLDNVVETKNAVGTLSAYAVRLQILTMAGEPTKVLYTKDFDARDLALPSTFSLEDLPEGSYKLDLRVVDQFHNPVEAASQDQCGLLIRRSCAKDENFDPETIACAPKLCDNAYRVGAIWSESLNLQRGEGQYECRLVEGKAQKISLSYTCKGGFVKADGACLAAKAVDQTCALLENNEVACWGTILRMNQFPYDPNHHDINIQIGFKFPEIPVNFGHQCVGGPSGSAFCWTQDYQTGYEWRTDANAPKRWESLFPPGFKTFDGYCGIDLQDNYWCNVLAGIDAREPVRTPEKIRDGNSSCVIDTKGQLYCKKGYLPASQPIDENLSYDGFHPVKDLPGPVLSLKRQNFTDCFLLSSGQVLCFGDNTDGAVGSNSSEQQVTKLSYVVDSNGRPISDMIQMDSVGGNVGGFCAVQRSGRVFCWGTNTSGQLANGTPGQDQEGFNLFSRFAVPINVEISRTQ